MSNDRCYSIDTSSLIHGWDRAYPMSVPMFKPVWEELSDMALLGQLCASVEVLHELKRMDDDLRGWCEALPDFFVEIDDSTQGSAIELLGRFPRLVDTHKGRSGADPWVISLAHSRDPAMTVVTEENGGSESNPKIPYVCRRLNIRCITLVDLLKEQSSI